MVRFGSVLVWYSPTRSICSSLLPIDIRANKWESEVLSKNSKNWKIPQEGGDEFWHIRIELIDPDGERFIRDYKTIPTSRKLSDTCDPKEILDIDHMHEMT